MKNVYTKLGQAQDYTWFMETETSEESIIEVFSLNFS